MQLLDRRVAELLANDLPAVEHSDENDAAPGIRRAADGLRDSRALPRALLELEGLRFAVSDERLDRGKVHNGRVAVRTRLDEGDVRRWRRSPTTDTYPPSPARSWRRAPARGGGLRQQA